MTILPVQAPLYRCGRRSFVRRRHGSGCNRVLGGCTGSRTDSVARQITNDELTGAIFLGKRPIWIAHYLVRRQFAEAWLPGRSMHLASYSLTNDNRAFVVGKDPTAEVGQMDGRMYVIPENV